MSEGSGGVIRAHGQMPASDNHMWCPPAERLIIAFLNFLKRRCSALTLELSFAGNTAQAEHCRPRQYGADEVSGAT